jgi:hypothetical protein
MTKKKDEMHPTPEQVAEKAHPGWKAVCNVAADAEQQVSADAVGADVGQILAKHRAMRNAEPTDANTTGAPEATIVPLEPETSTDRRGPRRSSVVQDGEEIGHSG